MRIWAVANQKGGVGKTTTVISLASLLAQRGYATLVLDMDPHGSLTTYLGYDPDSLENSIYTLFQQIDTHPQQAIASCLKKTKVEHLFLLPAATAMATLDRQLGVQHGKGLVIQKVLALLESRFDYVLIDCPPMLGVLMINALAACDTLVIPVQTEFLAMKGLERMIQTLAMITRSRHHALPYLIVPTMFDKRTRAANQSLQHLQQNYAAELWTGVIPVDTQFRDASKAGLPLPTLQPQARGSLAYATLLNSLLAASSSEKSVTHV